jgi:tellurite resistance-related uncharacterized protein
MFYLKDTLVGKTQTKATVIEKMKATSKMRNYQNLKVFEQAVKHLILTKQFFVIPEDIVQIELLNAIASSVHYSLIEPL